MNSDLSEISQEQLWLLDTSASRGRQSGAKMMTASQVDPPGSTSAGGQDDDAASVLSRSSSGGDRRRGNTQFPRSPHSHGTPGPKSLARRPTHRSTHTRSQAGDLVGKYRAQASATDLEATPLGSNPPPGDSTLGSSVPHSPPRSESKCPVERPSSSDTGHNARLASKGSVQQSPVNRPVYSEHAPVTPVPGKPGTGQMTSTRYRDPGARFHRPHRVHRSHRVHLSVQSTLVRKFKRKRLISAWPGLSFLFLIHRPGRCN